jgi:hypothetical protein
LFSALYSAYLWCELCSRERVPYPAKRFVYIIRSLNHPESRYIGVTSDVAARLDAHNAGQNRATAARRPWAIDVAIEFRNALRTYVPIVPSIEFRPKPRVSPLPN